jgi:hypothetical protein
VFSNRIEAYPHLIKELKILATPPRSQLIQMLKKLLCREATSATAEACVSLLQAYYIYVYIVCVFSYYI